MIDDYILGKLDARRKRIFEDHLPACEKCRKELAIMRLFRHHFGLQISDFGFKKQSNLIELKIPAQI
jgi:anti-sigma factor RsiW